MVGRVERRKEEADGVCVGGGLADGLVGGACEGGEKKEKRV